MDAVLWHVLLGTRGAANRARLLRALDEHPRNANQLVEVVEQDYKTVRHHLDVLMENELVETDDAEYGAVYMPTSTARQHWETIEQVFTSVK